MDERMDQVKIEPEWFQLGSTWRHWTRPGMTRGLVVLGSPKSVLKFSRISIELSI